MDSSAALLTSRMRSEERDGTIALIQGDMVHTVVATQCLEAGVDLSFDALLTEACPFPALIQRIGRLNRDGTATSPEGVLVIGKDPSKVRSGSEAVYGLESVAATNRLLLENAVEGVVNLSLERQGQIIQADDVWPLPERCASFHRGYLDLMATTYPTPWSDFPLESFIVGPDQDRPLDVTIAWRDDLKAVGSTSLQDGEQLSIPLPAVRAMLAGHRIVDISDLDGAGTGSPVGSASSDLGRALVRRDDGWEVVDGSEIRPGDVLVVSSNNGGYAEDCGWSPKSRSVVSDLSLVTALQRVGDSPPFPVSPATLLPWLKRNGHFDESSEHPLITRVAELISEIDQILAGDVLQALKSLAPPELGLEQWGVEIVEDAIIARRCVERRQESGPHQSLDQHQEQVAATIALACVAGGLNPLVTSDIVMAGRWHDAGKKNEAFQRYLGNQIPSDPWAKSRRGRGSRRAERSRAKSVGYSLEWRHEGASAHEARSEGLDALTIHLIGSHHGRFRPLLSSPVGDEGGQAEIPGHVEDFTELNRVWGPWGLAYLEAMVRLSDWLASAFPQKDVPVLGPYGTSNRAILQSGVPSVSARTSGEEVRLRGVLPTPLSGWYVIAALLRTAHDVGDKTATVHWPYRRGHFDPIWASRIPLQEICELLTGSEQWQVLSDLGKSLDGGFTRKNQKVGPVSAVTELLLGSGAWISHGLVQDAAPREAPRESGPDLLSLSIPAMANNASYIQTALEGLKDEVRRNLFESLKDPLVGWTTLKCDGGMDRSTVDDGVTGREVKDHRMIRTSFAPAALLGMASMGPVGVGGLGVRRRELRLPLPGDPTNWHELKARTHAVRVERGRVLEYGVQNIGYEKLWRGRVVGQREV